MNDIEKEFVPYVESLALKELGFDEPCLRVGNPNGHIMWKWLEVDDNIESVGIDDILKTSFDKRFINIPTYSQAFRWFRDKFNCDHYIGKLPKIAIEAIKRADKYKGNYQWMVTCDDSNPPCPSGCSGIIEGYEEAELACLQKLIELCKKK